MQKILSVLVALAFVATVAPAAQAETSYADVNIEWLLETYPELEGFPQEALDEFGERSSRVNLAAVTSGATTEPLHVGDVWVLGITNGCPAGNVIAPGHGQYVPVDPQLWLYPDPVQQVSATGSLTAIGWTLKSVGFHSSVEITGVTDNFCFEFFGIGLYFPFINGVVVGN